MTEKSIKSRKKQLEKEEREYSQKLWQEFDNGKTHGYNWIMDKETKYIHIVIFFKYIKSKNINEARNFIYQKWDFDHLSKEAISENFLQGFQTGARIALYEMNIELKTI